MMDLGTLTATLQGILQDPFILGIALMIVVLFFGLSLLYIMRLRREMHELMIVCSTDEKLRKVLQITDELLGKLPNDEVESFVSSPDFDTYKQAMMPIVGAKAVPDITVVPAKKEEKKDEKKPQPAPLAPAKKDDKKAPAAKEEKKPLLPLPKAPPKPEPKKEEKKAPAPKKPAPKPKPAPHKAPAKKAGKRR